MPNDQQLKNAENEIKLLRKSVAHLISANMKLLAIVAARQGDTVEDFKAPPSIGEVHDDLTDARDALANYTWADRASRAAGKPQIG